MQTVKHHRDDGVLSHGRNGQYALLTAAYNEEAHIEKTIQSLLGQFILPSTWVIVSDGCTDRTDEIVQRYATKYPFIKFIRRNRDHNRRFASKVCALRVGLQYIRLEANQFIGHLDADVVLDPSYFCELLMKFDEDPALGLAGGWFIEKTVSGLRPARGTNPTTVPGGIQMFRRQCYEDIGGLLPIEYGGEDWYAEIMARKCGWRVRSFSELPVLHLRETGTAGNALHYCYHQGFSDFCLGSHPLFELGKVAKRISWPPYLLGAMARLLGFLTAHFCEKRMVPPDFVEFLRKEQMARLWPHPFALLRS
jgi:Glycosyl transferase family 2